MNKEKMLKWADALESGKFKQTRGAYGSGFEESVNTGFCCLNVAFYVEHGVAVYERNQDVYTCPLTNIKEVYGINNTTDFIHWNDEAKLSFKKIAGKIREMVDAED